MKIYGKIGAVLTAAAMVVSMSIAQVGAVVGSKPHSDLYSFRMTENGTLALTNCSGKAAIPERYPDDMEYFVDDPYLPGGTTPDYSGIAVTAIDDWAFANNKFIETADVPGTIRSVGKGAFYNCVNLKSATLPAGVTELAANTFEKCLYLENVRLGNQLKTIGDEAFYDCRRLKSLDIPQTVTAIGDEAFTNCRSMTTLVIPEGVQKIGSEDIVGFGMFENCKALEEITIPETVGYIQPNAFEGCKNVMLLGENDSYSQQYAISHQLPFKAIVVPDNLVGDVNSDEKVDVTDASEAQLAVAELTTLTARQAKAADVNHDGVVDVIDVTLIQLYAAEMIDSF